MLSLFQVSSLKTENFYETKKAKHNKSSNNFEVLFFNEIV